MSNRLCIQQEEKTVRHTAEMSKVVELFDNYGQGSLDLDEIGFFDNELDLLRWVVKQIQEDDGVDNIGALIEEVFFRQLGISIEGIWYDWEQLKPVFEEMGYGEDDMKACNGCGREISYLKHQEGQGLCGICVDAAQ